MALSRYNLSEVIDDKITSSRANVAIKKLVDNNQITTTTIVLKKGTRLDHLANQYYNNGSLWWVIAAASGIGWWLQVPPGTLITIPLNIDDIRNVIGD